MAKIWSELWESILQLFLVHQFHPFGIECGKAGSIGDERTAAKTVEFDMARGVAAAAKLFRNLAYRQLKLRAGAVEETGFSDAGIAGQAGKLSVERFAQSLDPLARLCTCDEHGNACLAVDLRKGLRRGQIVLIDDDEGRDTLHLGDGEDTVDQERLRHWDGAGGQHDKLVDVGDCRADERVFPGQKFLQNALIALSGNADKIADEGRLVLSPEASSGAAFDNAIFRLYIIEAAQGFDDTILFHMLTQTGSAANHRLHRQDRHQPVRFPCL